MKKLKLMLLLLICITVCGCTSSSKGTFKSIDFKEYKKMIENKESFVLEQWGTTCSHCASLKPKLQKLVNEYSLTVYTIDMDKLAAEEKIEYQKYTGTTATPIIIFYKDGEEKSVAMRSVGDVPYEKLVQKFKDNKIID